ncbi:MAG TPA: chitobiase/beta-hexosaminidase C-terminal domain-containing protein [Verrucomicrobiae bacterium]|jgi:hypothetical protein|nr:chitobiase/beta-hexosaminidase C-terminal domain-containing protein [Verrucomicrobiae bacterium]
MSDLLLTLQQDLVDKLNSEAAFYYVPAVSWRKQVIRQEIERRLPHLLGKNGRKGCGMVVNMPRLEAIQPNLAAPQGDVLASIDVVEQPELNFNAGGTMVTAEEIARAVRRALHQFAIEGKILLYQDKKAIEPLDDLKFPGCLGYRVHVRGRMAELPQAKCVIPAIAEAVGTVSLTTTDGGAAIYYTVDGTFPGTSNAAALLYGGPFAVSAGTIVRWAAYKTGFLGSDAAQAVIS